MAEGSYRPPVQSQIGQIFDTLFLLVLVLASLFAPLYLELAGSGKTTVKLTDTSWAGMHQNATRRSGKSSVTPTGPRSRMAGCRHRS